MPNGHVTAIDRHAGFIEDIAARWRGLRVDTFLGDMLTPVGPFDFIWSAGAVYNLGIFPALTAWRGALAPGGHVAFSHPGWFTMLPSDGAREFWQGYDGVLTPGGLAAAVDDAGYRTVATRPLDSLTHGRLTMARLEERIARSVPMRMRNWSRFLTKRKRKSALWRRHRTEIGYLLTVVRPA